MSGTDFFDDDLVKGAESSVQEEHPVGEDVSSAGRPGKMARYREDVDEQVVRTSEELERLHQRQEALEKERRELQEVRNRQDEFESSRQELVERLGSTVLTLEREEVRAETVVDVISSTRQRFKVMLGELEELNAEVWDEDHIRDELGKSLTVIEDSRMEYEKSMSRVDALKDSVAGAGNGPAHAEANARSVGSQDVKPFGYWLKVGLAVSTPLLITVVVVALVAFYLSYRGLI